MESRVKSMQFFSQRLNLLLLESEVTEQNLKISYSAKEKIFTITMNSNTQILSLRLQVGGLKRIAEQLYWVKKSQISEEGLMAQQKDYQPDFLTGY